MNKLTELFKKPQPVLAMLHLKGNDDDDVLERAKREISLYFQQGVDGVIVENYFGHYYQMVKVLKFLSENYSDKIYGVNCLNMDIMGFELAMTYGAKFVQLDSVAGHLKPRDDHSFEAFINLCRERYQVLVFGGVRFKYQPYLSERSLEEDLMIAKERCDAIVVTGDHTGEETDLTKIKNFRRIIGDFPLIIGAGVSPINAQEQMAFADGAIVGSYFKDKFKDDGEVDADHVSKLVDLFEAIRRERK